MKRVTKYLMGLVGVVGLVLQSSVAQHAVGGFLQTHPGIASLIAALGAAGALYHDPKSTS